MTTQGYLSHVRGAPGHALDGDDGDGDDNNGELDALNPEVCPPDSSTAQHSTAQHSQHSTYIHKPTGSCRAAERMMAMATQIRLRFINSQPDQV